MIFCTKRLCQDFVTKEMKISERITDAEVNDDI
jgi:hypothetical protein